MNFFSAFYSSNSDNQQNQTNQQEVRSGTLQYINEISQNYMKNMNDQAFRTYEKNDHLLQDHLDQQNGHKPKSSLHKHKDLGEIQHDLNQEQLEQRLTTIHNNQISLLNYKKNQTIFDQLTVVQFDEIVKYQKEIINDTELFVAKDIRHKTHVSSIKQFLRSSKFQTVYGLIMTYCLFIEDLKSLVLDKTYDTKLDYALFYIYGVLLMDVLTNIFQNKNYTKTVLFYIDIVVSFNMLLQFSFINEFTFAVENKYEINIDQLDRSGEFDMFPYKAGQIFRMLKLAIIIKIYQNWSKVYKKFLQQKQLKAALEEEIVDTKQEYKKKRKRGQVQKKLSKIYVIRVLILVMILLIVTPGFNHKFFAQENHGFKIDFSLIVQLCEKAKDFNVGSAQRIAYDAKINSLYTLFKNKYTTQQEMILLQVSIPPINQSWEISDFNTIIQRLRKTEQITYIITGSNNEKYSCMIDQTYYFRLTALFNILKSIFVSTLLIFSSIVFSQDANKIALQPIEFILDNIEEIAQNPMRAYEVLKNRSLHSTLKYQLGELDTIENAILQIGVLLGLGFGIAGQEIIVKNIGYGEVDPLIPGTKKMAIFGFCDIREFSQITSLLQEDMMVFVNSIANTVHTIIDQYQGSPNKNIGDVFVVGISFLYI